MPLEWTNWSKSEVLRLEEAYIHEVFQSIDLAVSLSRLSPFSCYLFGCTELAGVGVRSYYEHTNNLNSYYQRFLDNAYFVFDKTNLNLNETELIKLIPEYRQPTHFMDKGFARSALDFSLLIIYTGITFFASYYIVSKMAV